MSNSGQNAASRPVCRRLGQFHDLIRAPISRLFSRDHSDTQAKSPVLCSLCQNTPFFSLPCLKRSTAPGDLASYTDRLPTLSLRGASYPFLADHTPSPPGFKHQCGLKNLKESANNCGICALIAVCVRNFLPHLHEYLNDETAQSMRPGFEFPETFQFWLASRRQGTPGFSIYTEASHLNNVYEVGEVAFVIRDGKHHQLGPSGPDTNWTEPRLIGSSGCSSPQQIPRPAHSRLSWDS